MRDLKEEQDEFVRNITNAQIKKWRKKPSDHHLITEAYNRMKSLLARGDGDTSWISDHVADILESAAENIRFSQELRSQLEASKAKQREELEALKAELREKEEKTRRLKGLKHFLKNVTIDQLSKWNREESTLSLITKAHDDMEKLFSNGDEKWVPTDVRRFLESLATSIRDKSEEIGKKDEKVRGVKRKNEERDRATLREIEDIQREIEARRRESETRDQATLREAEAIRREAEAIRREAKALQNSGYEAKVPLWSNIMPHDPQFTINSTDTASTSVPHFYSPDKTAQWDFAKFKQCAYSFDELQEFVGNLVQFRAKRSALFYSAVYLRDYNPSTHETGVVDIMQKLCEAAYQCLGTPNEPNHHRLYYPSSNLHPIFDFVSGRQRRPDGRITLNSFPICMIEYKTDATFDPSMIEEFKKETLETSVAEVNIATRPGTTSQRVQFETVKHPVTQVCCYMMLSGCRYGILSNWQCTYFLKLDLDEDGKTTLHYSERFEPWTAAMAQDENANARGAGPGNISMGEIFSGPPASLLQAMTVFVHLAMKGETLIPSGLDIDGYQMAIEKRISDSPRGFPSNGPNVCKFVSNVATSTAAQTTFRQAGSDGGNSQRESMLAVLTACTAKGRVVALDQGYSVEFLDSTLEIAGQIFTNCHTKASLVLDDENSYDTGYFLNHVDAINVMADLKEEARLYEGAARALQAASSL